MKNNVFQTIIKNKIPCYFVSPHLDDAALSAGTLMHELAKYTNVSVINVFSQVTSQKNTFSAKKTLAISKKHSANLLYKIRRAEDYEALSSINIKVINLDFVEALWRMIPKQNNLRKFLGKILPEFSAIYPFYKKNIINNKFSHYDIELVKNISNKLHEIIPAKAIVFCPIGIGNHVDHLITRSAVEQSFNPIYWADQPYLERTEDTKGSLDMFTQITSLKMTTGKKELIKKYTSQVDLLFPEGIPNFEEKFYQYKDEQLIEKNHAFLSLKDTIWGNLVNVFSSEKHHANYPLSITKGRTISILRKQNQENANSIIMYTDTKKKKKIIKHIWYEKNILDAKRLIHEANILRFIKNFQYKISNKIVKTPNIISFKTSGNEISLTMNYIQGKLLKDGSKKTIREALIACLTALDSIQYAGIKNKNIPKTSSKFIFLIFSVYFFVACLKNYKNIFTYIQLWITYYISIIRSFSYYKNLVFCHKSLHPENIIINDDHIFIIDFQLSTFSEKYTDLAISGKTYLKILGEIEMKKIISAFVKDFDQFKKLAIFYSFQALALSKKNHYNYQYAENFLHFIRSYNEVNKRR